MATKEHAGIRSLAIKIVHAVAVANGRQALGPEELRAAEAELNRVLGTLLNAVDRAADQYYNAAYQDEIQHHRNANKLRAALERFNRGE